MDQIEDAIALCLDADQPPPADWFEPELEPDTYVTLRPGVATRRIWAPIVAVVIADYGDTLQVAAQVPGRRGLGLKNLTVGHEDIQSVIPTTRDAFAGLD